MKTFLVDTYRGEVVHADNDSVVVVYDVDGDLVEHIYHREQFVDQKLPPLGTLVESRTVIVELPPEIEAELPPDTGPRRRKNTATYSREF